MYRVSQYMLTAANSQKNPQFNFELCSLFRTQPTHLHKCRLKILNSFQTQAAYSRKHCRLAKTHTYPRSHLKWLLIRLLHADVPISNSILSMEQIRHSSKMLQLATEEQCPTLGANCCTGVFSRTIKSLVHALGTDS